MVLLFPRRRAQRRGQQGYALLILLLILALMIIATAAIVPSVTFDLKRDREEEMVHRGVQYSRAIRLYYKKFGRYPVKIEDLENTNQQRFLRKRYKDPLTGKDFKLLHFGEVKLSAIGGIGGATIPGASPIGANGGLNSPGGLAPSAGFGGNNSAFGGNSGFGANSNSAFGQNQGANNQNAGEDATQATPDAGQQGSQTPAPGNGAVHGSTDQLAGVTFGGAPIVGVASTSKDKTIREYNKKKKYNEWAFVYDPTMDRGMLITTPYQPQLMQFGLQGAQNLNGLNGKIGGQNNSTGFGNNPGNQPGGIQNNQNPPTEGLPEQQ